MPREPAGPVVLVYHPGDDRRELFVRSVVQPVAERDQVGPVVGVLVVDFLVTFPVLVDAVGVGVVSPPAVGERSQAGSN